MRQKLLKLGLVIVLLGMVVHVPSSFGQEEAGARILIDDFELLTDWWSYEAGSNSFNCQITNTGYDSNNALEITFDVGKTGSPACGFDQIAADGFWSRTAGLEFMWRADLSYMAVQVIVQVYDFSQTNPDASEFTEFEAYVLTEGDMWTMGQVAWEDFEKADWIGDGGVDVIDPSRVYAVLFSAAEWERGTVWIDNLYAVEQLMDEHELSIEYPPLDVE